MAEAEAGAVIAFSEWTIDDALRHSIFVGLRDDKEPSEVVRESVNQPADFGF